MSGGQTVLSEVFEGAAIGARGTMARLLAALAEHAEVPRLAVVLAEVLANAVHHGKARRLTLLARRRHGLLLLQVDQDRALPGAALAALRRAQRGPVPVAGALHGRGFPMMVAEARCVLPGSAPGRLLIWLPATALRPVLSIKPAFSMETARCCEI